MHEKDKLDEARYFFAGMTGAAQNSLAFQHELSAFLSSARSVLQYALEEAKTKTGGRTWFDTHASKIAVLRFFKDKRDVSIHERPVVPAVTLNIDLKEETIRIPESVAIQAFDKEGKLVSDRVTGSTSPPPVPSSLPSVSLVYRSPKVSLVYHFPDWTGREDVLQLCRDYITALETLVNDGQAQGFLTRS